MFVELNDMLLGLMLELHAWSSSRPTHERDATAAKLDEEMLAVPNLENEQGRSLVLLPSQSLVGRRCSTVSSVASSTCFECSSAHYLFSKEKARQRLNEFVDRIKMALAALTGL